MKAEAEGMIITICVIMYISCIREEIFAMHTQGMRESDILSHHSPEELAANTTRLSSNANGDNCERER